MLNSQIKQAYQSYFAFNNQRTLSTSLPSELTITESEDVTLYKDKTRRYDNQVVIHSLIALNQLEECLLQYQSHWSPEICVEPAAKTDELATWLGDRGFQPSYQHEFLHLQAHDYASVPNTPQGVTIERWKADKADAFFELLQASGLVCPDDTWQQKRTFYCTEQFRCFVAKIDGKACAWATSYLISDHAILANAFTFEQARGQGCQTALLNARITDAIDLGARELLTDVMPNSVSSRNCHSVGFTSLGIRAVWEQEQ
ncbi:GNAT family N-acetyltransferase [Vibrio sp. T187]|nr:GNAT family N-acetyltransferase [Vibrio sp. T187]